MKNPNSPVQRAKKGLISRWQADDGPGTESRFQITLFAKDVLIFLGLPLLSIILFKGCEAALSRHSHKSDTQAQVYSINDGSTQASQVITFGSPVRHSKYSGVVRRAPGTLVKVRLLNVVDTYANAPVHAEIIDSSLGSKLIGATIVGTATADSAYNRINIDFSYVRDSSELAIPIKAHALSLDGTLGLSAQKKEGFFARAALDSSNSASQGSQNKIGGQGLDGMIARALASGLLQEFGSESKVAQNHSQLLTLRPLTEFYVELTDYFPSQSGGN